MKLLHTADLHIGKRLGEYSLLEDQRYILRQIFDIVKAEQPDGVLLAGDIYDKSVPSAEAVELFDGFLTALAALRTAVLLISGNHDSPERLGFGSRIFEQENIHIAGVFDGRPARVTLNDEWGEVSVWLLPFLRPAAAAPFFPDAAVETHEDAVRAALAACAVDPAARNVLLAHQFVTAGGVEPERCDSESVYVGGLDNVDCAAFDAFDYVALGHLHGAQRIGRDTVRYAGSPLKYSFSEARQRKSVTLVELGPKGDVSFTLLPLSPLRDMREIKGSMRQLLAAAEQSDDYIHATLTDADVLLDAAQRLRQVYPNLMRLDFETGGAQASPSKSAASDVEHKTPLQLFEDFYESQNGAPLDERARKALLDVLKETEAGA